MTFGDDDPEDAYDVGDPIPVRLANLERRLRWFLDRPSILRGTHQARLARIRDDLATIRAELE